MERQNSFAVAFIGAEAPTPERCRALAAGAGAIAAADSGLIACEAAGLTPNVIAGDMDSLEEAGQIDRLGAYPAAAVRRYPRDKDQTDTEIVLALLREQGFERIRLIGGGGGRLDHLFALRELFERPWCPLSWHTLCENIFMLDAKSAPELTADFPAGSLVSVLVLGGGPWKAQSAGLQWPLDAVEWRRGVFGVSNIVVADSCTLRARAGRFLVICKA